MSCTILLHHFNQVLNPLLLGSSKSFPFLSPFQAFPVWNWERKGPFPVANWERIHQFWERIFPGKGSFPKIDESFPSCSLSWERKGPFPVTNRDIRSRAKFRVPEIQTGSIFCLPPILKRILILNPNS